MAEQERACHVSIFPRTSGSPPTEFTTDKKHRVFDIETSTFLDNKGRTVCRGSRAKGSNVFVNCKQYDKGSHNLEVCNDDAVE
jgi:hypothetical protein